MIYRTLGVFIKTLTAIYKYFLLNRDNLTQPIQMQLFKKQKSFSQFFPHSWNIAQILNIME